MMDRTRRGMLLLIGAGVSAAGGNQKAALTTLIPQGASRTGDDVVQQVSMLVREKFFDPIRAAKFDEAVSNYRTTLGKSYDYRTAIKVGLSALRASHNEFYTPAELDYYELGDIYVPILKATGNELALRRAFPPDGVPKYDGIGIVAERSADGWYIAYIYDASPAARSSLKVGDVVLTADGLPFDPIESFRGKAGMSATLGTARSKGGIQHQVRIDVVSINPNLMTDESIKASVKTYDIDGGKLGYLRLWTYSTPEVQQIVQYLLSTEPLNAVSGLILDMRCRRGGAPPDAVDTFVGVSPELEMTGRSTKNIVNFRYRKPVIGLIDSRTRSGMEVFAYTLKKVGVTLVGGRTEGAVLGGSPFLLNDNSLLSISVMDVTVDGHVLEGVGVSPDFDVPYEKLYSQGLDPQIEEARNQLGKLLYEDAKRGRKN